MAIDLGKFNSMACVYDKDTQEQQFETVATERGFFKTLLNSYCPELVVVEACGPSGWVSDLCGEMEIPILVCSTHEEAWLRKNVKRKTDKDDALKLARLASMGELVPTHVPTKPIRERRRLIKYRKKIVDRINSSKCTIRSVFANQGIPISQGAKTWHSGRVDLIEQSKPLNECEPNDLWRGELDLELKLLETLESHLETIEKQLNQIAKTDTQIQRVQTINGVGRVTAEAIVNWIDDPHRFKSAREVGAYAGLVPWQYQSGQTDRRGRITKRGPKLLRTILVECAWCSLQYNQWSRETYDRIHAGKQPRRKKAAVAMARKILVLAWAMMRDEVDYDPERNLEPDPKPKQTAA
jgi:transposase